MNEFDHFSDAALTFLSDLAAHNRRDWFTAHKQIYETEIKEPAKRFGAAMTDALHDLTGQIHSAKIYRINRDVRFSKDKTPYNAHLHLSFAPEADCAGPPMWFFGLSPDKLTVGCGVFQYAKDDLATFRAKMDGPAGRALIRLTAELRARGLRVGEPDLKRVPPGFDARHPNAEALRRKGFSSWKDLEGSSFATAPRLVPRTVEELQALLPVFRLLSEIR